MNRIPRLDRPSTASVWCRACQTGWGEMPAGAVRLSSRGCGHEGYYGPEPDEYLRVCPSCDSVESLVEEDRWLYRMAGRHPFTIHHHSQRTAA